MITLTDEQRAAVQADGNIFLSACPGSGKTRVITAKLLSLAEAQEGTTQSIACITYTNAAVDEIELRLKQAGNASILDHAEVSTIHSFCLQYILRPYKWLAPDVPQPFKILTREMPEFEELVTIAVDEIRRVPNFQTIEDYDSIDIDMDGEPFGQGITSGSVTRERAFRFWELMRARGYIDFSLILYYSYEILQANPFVAEGVSSRFQWILIDEFQDTTEVQLAIFEALHDKGHSRFFLVGDENQSILDSLEPSQRRLNALPTAWGQIEVILSRETFVRAPI
jgi:DNA helicase-2/ATP-dependent DNA helicase PcrA